jgi:transposase-like protein
MAKSKYNPDHLILVQGWARDGLTDAQIAHNLGINPDTLYAWKKRYPEFAETLTRTKAIVDREVENALFKRAVGYTVDEVTYDEAGVEIKRVTKEVPPDVTAQIFWLKNRKVTEWRDKRDVEHSGDVGLTWPQLMHEARDYLRVVKGPRDR